MTKTFCDVCGKELISLETVSAYSVSITIKNRMCHAPSTKNYTEVCEDYSKKIAKFIDDIRIEN